MATDASTFTVKTASGQVARPLSDIVDDCINVIDYINPNENVSIGINLAIETAANRPNNRRGCVVIPNLGADYVLSQPIVMRKGVQLYGLGRPRLSYDSTTMRAAIISEQFDTLYGSGSGSAGDEHMLIDNFYIFGQWISPAATDLPNRETNGLPKTDYTTPGARRDAIAIYGRSCHIRNVWIERCRGNGIHYAYGNQGSASPFDGHITNVSMNTIGEHGLINDIDDCHIQDINITSASRGRHGSFCNILAKSGFHGVNINLWSAGSQYFRPMYGLWFAGGGGSEYIGGTVESGTEGTVRIDTARVLFHARAHSTAGVKEGTSTYRGAAIIVNGHRSIINALTYHGSQSAADIGGNGGSIAPLVLGGVHRNLVGITVPDSNPPTTTYAPENNIVTQQIYEFTRPVDLAGSGGKNSIIIRGEHGTATNQLPVLAGNTAADTLDIDVGGPSTYRQRREAYATASAKSGADNENAMPIVSGPNTRVFTQASGWGVRLEPSSPGAVSRLFNRGPGSMNVFPPVGGKFWGGATDASVAVAANTGATFVGMDPDWARF